ncbi:hypothetical protein [Paenirhodobacter populi]|uniref:Uncharacterized protein n=1 Tax=Paenirhodobacter populi TaxID=2306993 RepID=A0A443KGY3_9RHOB|nr:hypothetical protein [Sinirhodobacter populi]RWR08358.1 hypothetical protein D2T32_09570 [Sinirhodobacter populi]RWR32021.1 hypothetical protein D2T31_03440 [Sinirhodobacter populi]
MTRHLIDRANPKAEGARVKHFLDLARREGVHPAVQELGQRPVTTRTARKVQEFLRIDRQESPAT